MARYGICFKVCADLELFSKVLFCDARNVFVTQVWVFFSLVWTCVQLYHGGQDLHLPSGERRSCAALQ